MKFGERSSEDAAGCILAHKTRLPGRMLKKGTVLTREDCADLTANGVTSVVVASLEAGDVGEDTAAARLGAAAAGMHVSEAPAFTGRTNLYADRNGVLVVDEAAVTAANRVDPSITFATLANLCRVASNRMIATAKIISFAVPENQLKQAEDAIHGAVSVAEFKPRKIGLVATELPHLKPATMNKTRRVLEDRLRLSGSKIVSERRVAHEQRAVEAAIRELPEDGADFLILFGASAVVDRMDILPAALDSAGGSVMHLGMPVDPGNLLMLGDFEGLPVLGAPGCARSPKENGFDWVLDRLIAGLEIGPEDITSMGVGGLLMEIGTRPQPREKKKTEREPKIAAIVLAAGKSSRMGGPNKLLALLDAKPLVRHAAEAAVEAGLSQTVMVTGHLAEKVGRTVADMDLKLVHNPDYSDGMAGSIRAGMNALEPDIDAAIILLGDMPRIGPDIVRKLVATYKDNENGLIVTATADGKRGNPVLWDSRFFDELKSLSGDIGARHLIAGNPGFVTEVEVGEAARLDLDTPKAIKDAGGIVTD